MSDFKKHWIIQLVPAVGFIAGVIMATIGATMTFSSVAKLILFDGDPYSSYVTTQDCRYDYEKRISVSTEIDQPYERTDEEINQCIKEKTISNKIRFQNNKKQDVVDGLSFLLVGFILLFSFRRKKE